MITSSEQLKKADWDQLEQDVVKRLRILRLTATSALDGELGDKIANDLILPALELLAEFCACVDIKEELC